MMTRSYIKPWEWFHNFGERATRVQDEARMKLYHLYGRASRDHQRYPQQAVALYREGVARAADLKEPWIEMFYEWWVASITIFELYLYEEGLDLAMKLVTKASRDAYLDFPFRAPVFLLLISVYFKLDGLSYIEEMKAMLETIETQMALDRDSHLRVFGYRADFWRLMGDQEKALETTSLYIEMSVNNDFRLTDGYETLCGLTYLQHRDQKALEYAHLTLDHALKSNRRSLISHAYWWQACLLFLSGDPQEAERLFRLGLGEVRQLERPKNISLWDGACRYYETIGAYDRALLFWDEQVQLMNPKTQSQRDHFEIFLRRCFVLRAMGRLTEADIEQTRQAAQRMRKPEKYLVLVDELHDGKTDIPRYYPF
jgi:hypothetical protein